MTQLVGQSSVYPRVGGLISNVPTVSRHVLNFPAQDTGPHWPVHKNFYKGINIISLWYESKCSYE